MKVSPVARTESLIVKEVDGETLVYDLTTDKAHCLNETAAHVWKSCDGRSTPAEIAQSLSTDRESRVAEDVVWLALDQLEKFKLLQQPVQKPQHLSGLSRRQVVRMVSVAAITLPLVTSIIAPVRAQLGSVGGCCLNDGDCNPGLCCWTAGPPGCPAGPGAPSKKFCIAKDPLTPPGSCP
jgi:hypothetical protein